MAGDNNNTSDIYAATAPFATPGEIHFATWRFDANSGSGQAVITVVRNAPFNAPATVDYSEHDNTTRAGSDYVATSGTLSFAAGQASATFTIPLNASDSFSGTRTATITLANPSGAPLGFPTATLNLTGILPVVPVTISASSTAAAHPKAHPKTPKAKATSARTAATPTRLAQHGRHIHRDGLHGPRNDHVRRRQHVCCRDHRVYHVSCRRPSAPGRPRPRARTTAASTTASTTSAAAVSTAGPIVSSLALRTTRHRITSVIISFSKPLASAAASNLANYGVRLLNLGRRTKQGVRMTTVGRAVGISSATYDSTANTVTLTLSTPVRSGQKFQVRVSGGTGGITDQSGNPLNSPSAGSPGSDFDYNVN